jgi:hypothetical protein
MNLDLRPAGANQKIIRQYGLPADIQNQNIFCLFAIQELRHFPDQVVWIVQK